jgi:NO-binding membrane sensor protein with MHYT domain
MKSTASVAESSLLLWMLAAIVLVMAVSASLGWVRQGMLRAGLHKRWLPAVIAAATLGTGICAAIVLALSAEALPFPIGYRLREVPLLWLAAMVGCFPAMALLCNNHKWYASIAGGLLIGGVAAYVQTGWVNAVGFKPGINFRQDAVMFGAGMMAVGVAIGLWLAFSELLAGPNAHGRPRGAAGQRRPAGPGGLGLPYRNACAHAVPAAGRGGAAGADHDAARPAHAPGRPAPRQTPRKPPHPAQPPPRQRA